MLLRKYLLLSPKLSPGTGHNQQTQINKTLITRISSLIFKLISGITKLFLQFWKIFTIFQIFHKSNSIHLFSSRILWTVMLYPAGLVHSFLSFIKIPGSHRILIAFSNCLVRGSSKALTTSHQNSIFSPLWYASQCSLRLELLPLLFDGCVPFLGIVWGTIEGLF